jgi:hypothetical protein
VGLCNQHCLSQGQYDLCLPLLQGTEEDRAEFHL